MSDTPNAGLITIPFKTSTRRFAPGDFITRKDMDAALFASFVERGRIVPKMPVVIKSPVHPLGKHSSKR